MAKVVNRLNYDKNVSSINKVTKLDMELTIKERNFLLVGYKNVIGGRVSWKIVSFIEHKEEVKGNDINVKRIKEYHHKVEDKLSRIFNAILTIISKHLIPSSNIGEYIIFYYKMKEDYYRHLGEFNFGDEKKVIFYQSPKDQQGTSNT
eukprot:Gb_21880 [translate_table: standard]